MSGIITSSRMMSGAGLALAMDRPRSPFSAALRRYADRRIPAMTSMLSGVSSMIRTVWADDITDIRSPTIPMPTGELFPAVTIPRLRRLPPAANPPQREGNSTITPATGQRPESFPASVSILGQSAGSDRNHRPLQLVGQEQAGIFRVLAGLRPQPQ